MIDFSFLLGVAVGVCLGIGAGAATVLAWRALEFHHQRQCVRLQLEATDAAAKRAQQQMGVH